MQIAVFRSGLTLKSDFQRLKVSNNTLVSIYYFMN